MTADEIRAHGPNDKGQEHRHNRDDFYWLREIAAQLAELNGKIQPTTSAGLKLAKRVVEYFGNEEIDPRLDCDIEIRDMARAIVATETAQ